MKKLILKNSIFSHFSNFQLQTIMVPIHRIGKFFWYLRYYLPPIPSNFTTIKILNWYIILLCSAQYFLIKKNPKKSHFDFWPTNNLQWRSPWQPITTSKILPQQLPTFSQNMSFSRFQPFLRYKTICTNICHFHHSGHLVFWPWKLLKSQICSFDTSGINYSPKVNKKPNMTDIEQIEYFQNVVHTLAFWCLQVIFHHKTLNNV